MKSPKSATSKISLGAKDYKIDVESPSLVATIVLLVIGLASVLVLAAFTVKAVKETTTGSIGIAALVVAGLLGIVLLFYGGIRLGLRQQAKICQEKGTVALQRQLTNADLDALQQRLVDSETRTELADLRRQVAAAEIRAGESRAPDGRRTDPVWLPATTFGGLGLVLGLALGLALASAMRPVLRRPAWSREDEDSRREPEHRVSLDLDPREREVVEAVAAAMRRRNTEYLAELLRTIRQTPPPPPPPGDSRSDPTSQR